MQDGHLGRSDVSVLGTLHRLCGSQIHHRCLNITISSDVSYFMSAMTYTQHPPPQRHADSKFHHLRRKRIGSGGCKGRGHDAELTRQLEKIAVEG
jgi:hypothetical protein